MKKLAFLILLLAAFNVKIKAQDVLITLLNTGCNICASNFGSEIDKFDSETSITFVVSKKQYYSIDNAIETIRQVLNLKREFNVLINDSITKRLNSSVKIKKDWGGCVFRRSENIYIFVSALSELNKNIKIVNGIKDYVFVEKVVLISPNNSKQLSSCPFCSFSINDSNIYFLSIYSAKITRLNIDSGITNSSDICLNLLDSTNYLSIYKQLNNGDTSGFISYSKNIPFNTILPFSIKMLNKNEGAAMGIYYTIVKDSLKNSIAGPSSPCVIYFNLLNNKINLVPIKLNNCQYSLRLTYYVSLNDSQLIFLLSNKDAVSKSDYSLFGLFKYKNNEIVFDSIIQDYNIPDIKNKTVGYIPLFNNNYILVPNTGEVINAKNRGEKYQLDYQNITAVIKSKYKNRVQLEKAWWIDYTIVNEQVIRLLFFYESNIYSLFINTQNNKVISSQTYWSKDISQRASGTRFVHNKVYYISKSGFVNSIALE